MFSIAHKHIFNKDFDFIVYLPPSFRRGEWFYALKPQKRKEGIESTPVAFWTDGIQLRQMHRTLMRTGKYDKVKLKEKYEFGEGVS